ncbi:hypothetical protein Tcan_10096 [Toxocara canis]|uniref:Uncharacterized protein n=1 Tax=Toxocara canis TaxID=6265 RepID=A0A0B2VVZ4_TOXCA|nr:hypothetical protein Tcan_10096 [Toxocara canis]
MWQFQRSETDLSEHLSGTRSSGYTEETIRRIPITPDPEITNGRLNIEYEPGTVMKRSRAYTVSQPTWLPNGDLDTTEVIDDPFPFSRNVKATSVTNEPTATQVKCTGLRRSKSSNLQTMLPVVLQGSEHGFEQTMLPRFAVASNAFDKDGVPPQSPHVRQEWPTGNVLLMTNEPRSDDSLILYVNDYIGRHRFVYSVVRFPALISIIVSTWILFGKNSPTDDQWKMALTAFITGLWIIIGQIYGLHNHNNWHPTAFIQTTFRVLHLCIDIPLSIAMIIFAVLTLKRVTSGERSAVLLSMGLMILCLSSVALVFGIVAWRNLRRDEKIHERHRKSLSEASSNDTIIQHLHT